MSIVYALVAAFCNALNVVTQHIASTKAPKKARGWHFVTYLFRSPIWLFGWIALAGAFVFQALALHNGELSVVQPVLVTELVFALVLRRYWVHQSIRGITWAAAALTTIGLGLFLAAAEPQGGHLQATTAAWTSATLTLAGAVALLMMLGHWSPRNRRAAFYGSATAIMWALVATFMKTTTNTLTEGGVGGTFVRWPVYALAASGLVVEVLNQAALHAGPLSISQPFLVIVDPLVSILLSVWIFGEHFTGNATALTVGTMSFAGMCVGAALLTRTAPATMEPARSK